MLNANSARFRAPRAPGRLLAPLAVLLLLAACTTAHRTTRTANAPSPGPYVALGDSYTAGPGIPAQVATPAGCERSDHNYPTLLARHLRLRGTKFRDVSCTGATIADLATPQTTSSGTNAAQLDALSADTAIVTLGIGGNDIGFSDVLTHCVALDIPGTLASLARHTAAGLSPCRAYYTAGGTDRIDQQTRSASTRLEDALARIRRRAPHAHVYVVGYPALLPSGGTSCERRLGLLPGDVAFLHDEERQLNTMLRQQALAASDSYVDTYQPSEGHDACSPPAERWIEPILTDAAAPLHPNALGEQKLAESIEGFLSVP